MIEKEDLISIGKFQKTHALKGELNMISDIDPEYFIEGNPLIIEDEGIMVPYYVSSIRPKGSTSHLVKIEGIENEAEASQFVNKDVYVLKEDVEEWIDDEIIDSNELIGYSIINNENEEEIGKLEEIDDTTSNLLFLVRNGDETIYIPANNDFIEEINDEKKIIKMNLPEGLLDLNRKKEE